MKQSAKSAFQRYDLDLEQRRGSFSTCEVCLKGMENTEADVCSSPMLLFAIHSCINAEHKTFVDV